MRTVVIGAGQAGLAVSRSLTVRNVDHVVLERARVAQSWRDRWDSLTLVTPNWTLALPGSPYDGTDPQGHLPRDEIVAYLERYRLRWQVPVREGIEVSRLTAGESARFLLETSDGDVEADNVVVCTGAFQVPHRRPEWDFPAGLPVLTPHDYRNPGSVPEGKVLVVGNGETGCQIAEELHLDGREVYLSCGRAPWSLRRLGDLDIITWLQRARFFEQRLDEITDEVRLIATPQVTGADGGRDLNFRTLQELGVRQLGRLQRVENGVAHFADDLVASVAFGDARWADARRLLADRLPSLGFETPEMTEPGAVRGVRPDPGTRPVRVRVRRAGGRLPARLQLDRVPGLRSPWIPGDQRRGHRLRSGALLLRSPFPHSTAFGAVVGCGG